MQFLRTIFWVVLAVLGAIFAVNNSRIVQVGLWGVLVADMPLWVVALVAFLIGLLPTLVLYRATRWSLRRRLDTATRALGEGRPAEITTMTTAVPPGAAPIAPPAGVA